MVNEDRHLERVAGVLAERIGLRMDGGLSARSAREVRRSAARCGVPLERYAEVLTTDDAEFARLVEAVTVQETSFFRHPEQLTALMRTLMTQPPAVADRVVWSAGCADGQEPWSLAMALEECGLGRWRVVGSDVSEHAVDAARAGIYEERQLKGLSEQRVSRFMRRTDDGRWKVARPIRERVSFLHHNLLDGVPRAAGECGVVLCRNVLIYLQRDRARAFLTKLRERMPADGILMLGTAEALSPQDGAFRATRAGRVYMYRPRSAAPEAPAKPSAGQPARPPRSRPRRRTEEALPEVSALLAEGERLTAERRFEEAIAAFRKALYLAPDELGATVKLALALDSAGDPGAARALRAAREAVVAADPQQVADALDGWPAEQVRRMLDGKIEVVA